MAAGASISIVAPDIAIAVYKAIGVRLREFLITPECPSSQRP